MFGLALAALATLVLAVVLPLVTFARVVGLSRDLQRLGARLDSLEQARAAAGPPAHPRDNAASAPEALAPALQAAAADTPPAQAPAGHPEAAPAIPLRGAEPPPPLARLPSLAANRTGEPWLEAAIGGRLLLYVGTAAVVLGLAFFLKYAFEHDWVTERMRVVLGAGAGAALIAAGLRFSRAGYDVYGQILAGGGLAALYLSVYAAFDFYGLIGRTTAFVLLLLVTLAAAVLSDRQRSQAMAIAAVGGGFLTPFVVGGRADAQVTLFAYVALLVAGTTWLAHRRHWPVLNVVSFALTVVTVAAWASVHYTPGKYLRTHLFLTLFCGMFLLVLREAWRPRPIAEGTRAPGPSFAARVLLLAPVLYHLASLAVLFPHTAALLVYLIAFTVAAVAWSVQVGRARFAPVLWAAAILPFFGWAEDAGARWVWAGAVTLAAIFGLHVLAQFDRLGRQQATLAGPDLLLLHLNGLGTLFGFYLLLEGVALAWVPLMGAILVLVHGGITWRMLQRDPAAALHALAVTFALLAATVAFEFDGPWLTAALAAEGAAVMWVGLRARAEWFRAGGVVLLAVACGRWVLLSLSDTPAGFQLVLNEAFLVGAWIVALLYLGAWLHRGSDRRGAVPALLVAASVLTVVLLTSQKASYWELRRPLNADATFAEALSLSVIWMAYAAVLIVAGITWRYPPIRYTAMALFGLTILKVFAIDMAGLEGIYRILGLVMLGVVLLAVSFLYQRVASPQGTPPGEAPTA
jgi:uncharacterized membrane protein